MGTIYTEMLNFSTIEEEKDGELPPFSTFVQTALN